MCTQCVAQGAAYVVPGLAALRLWSRRRTRSQARQERTPTVNELAAQLKAADRT
ncbi:MAG TPA: hypothetical protein VFU93_15880 [Acidimicrobiales bacterium]|nr:hypothetical protein [Acidimicrobiales bacterium]